MDAEQKQVQSVTHRVHNPIRADRKGASGLWTCG